MFNICISNNFCRYIKNEQLLLENTSFHFSSTEISANESENKQNPRIRYTVVYYNPFPLFMV